MCGRSRAELLSRKRSGDLEPPRSFHLRTEHSERRRDRRQRSEYHQGRSDRPPRAAGELVRQEQPDAGSEKGARADDEPEEGHRKIEFFHVLPPSSRRVQSCRHVAPCPGTRVASIRSIAGAMVRVDYAENGKEGMRPRPQPGQERIPSCVRLFDPATLARLCRARDWLGDRFHERVSLADSACQAYLSPFYFSRLFTEVFGEPPHEFVTRPRIAKAKRLVLSDHSSVIGICFVVGYESLGSFSTRFHTLTGLSPAAFRREAHRLFGGFRSRWPLYYVPACYQRFYVGGETPQESRSATSAP